MGTDGKVVAVRQPTRFSKKNFGQGHARKGLNAL
ncbi:hypothetical protein FOPG_19528 [Fusarium oxysporum f. sp. conglutinans race 2 54008]|uniref:Uncharacterized protein n=1 Tax=Fusarium oxysporum f. sp. conglutinans race 2 54008 TaxID=1089457 RepID=X0GLL9_FUSOX|nr:hypothetical protein FOPG_19528 [Fusarium oxysporum f. sp. conglutinans race 2 54008]